MTQNIPKYINQLLYKHECVIISGLGAFITFDQGTLIDEKKNYFTPNKKSISFNSEIKKNDGLLANYIAEIENISYEEACVILASLTKKILAKINNGEKYLFESIGSLKLNSSGEIIFEPEGNINFNPDFFGLESFYFPKINHKKTFIQPQYISGISILFIFICIGFFLSENMILNNTYSNTASFNPKIQKEKNITSQDVSGLYKIRLSQIDYDLYKILGTNYHLSTKRCFKMGDEIEAHLKIYNGGKNKKQSLCFLNEVGLEFTDCYQIKKVYNQIPTSSNNLIVVDKKGKMRNAILVFEETEIDYKTLLNNENPTIQKEPKDDIASRFLDAVKTLSEKSNNSTDEKPKPEKPLNIKKDNPSNLINKTEDSTKSNLPKVLNDEIKSNKDNPKNNKNQEIENSDNVFIIVGCFSSKKNAENLVTQLNKKGYKEACLAGQSSKRNLFRVACSKFKTEKEANKNLKKLKQVFEGAWVLNRN